MLSVKLSLTLVNYQVWLLELDLFPDQCPTFFDKVKKEITDGNWVLWMQSDKLTLEGIGSFIFSFFLLVNRWMDGYEGHYEGCEALEQVAQSSSWVTIPGGLQEMYRCAERHGLVMDLALGLH